MCRRLNLIGKVFGRLKVIEFSGLNKHKHTQWKCLCECGNSVIVEGARLNIGHTKSCGCFQRQRASETHKDKIVSEETRNKLSTNHHDVSGNKNPMFGIRRFGKDNPMFGVSKYGSDNPNYGKKASRKSKKKMSDSHKGQIPWNKGIPCSDETKKKISEATTGKYVGSNSHNWKETITNEERIIGRKYPEYYDWRSNVYERDNYICQKCSKVSCKLNAHHIESYSNNKELRITVDNGITFCEICHKKFHNIYGKSDSNRKQLNEFLGKN